MTDKPWYAVRLFGMRARAIEEAFKTEGFRTFIPMHYEDYEDANGHHKRRLRPVVSNLLFVESGDEKKFKELVSSPRYKVSVIKPTPTSKSYAMISAKEMSEFISMCNPDMEVERLIVSDEEARMKTGDHVVVHHGPLKGMHGRLVRKNKKYYLLKEITGGLGVMIKVARWCCAKQETE